MVGLIVARGGRRVRGVAGSDLGAGGEVELAEDGTDVGVDRAGADEERGGDLLVRQAARDQGGDLALARGEAVGLVVAATARRGPARAAGDMESGGTLRRGEAERDRLIGRQRAPRLPPRRPGRRFRCVARGGDLTLLSRPAIGRQRQPRFLAPRRRRAPQARRAGGLPIDRRDRRQALQRVDEALPVARAPHESQRLAVMLARPIRLLPGEFGLGEAVEQVGEPPPA
jgi:hypothetical protein